jgi:hypothetical protein
MTRTTARLLHARLAAAAADATILYSLLWCCPLSFAPRPFVHAGRAELPESLKALFRPITVVVPDRQLIMENMLMAEVPDCVQGWGGKAPGRGPLTCEWGSGGGGIPWTNRVWRQPDFLEEALRGPRLMPPCHLMLCPLPRALLRPRCWPRSLPAFTSCWRTC